MVKGIHSVVNSIKLTNGNLFNMAMPSNPAFDKPNPTFRCNHYQFFHWVNFRYISYCMPKFLLTLLLFTVLGIQASAGNVDSLKSLLKNNIHDTTKCRLLLEISVIAEMQDIAVYADQLIAICDKNLSNSGKLDKIYKKFKVEALLNLAIHYRHVRDVFRCEQLYDSAYSIISTFNDKMLLAMYYGNIASYFKHIGKIDEAIKQNYLALKIYESQVLTSDQKIELATLYNNIGVLYRQQDNIHLAIEYSLKAIEIAKIPGYENNLVVFMINTGSYYSIQHEDSLALSMYLKALHLAKNAKIRSIYLSYAYEKIGLYYYGKKEYKLADAYLDSAINISDKSGDIDMKGVISRDKAMVALKMKQHSRALNFALQSLEIANKSGSKEAIMLVEKVLYDIYNDKKQFQFALEHFQKYISLLDSISNSKNINSLEKAKLSYEYEKKLLTDSLQLVVIQNENEIKLEQKQHSLETEKKIRVAIISISALAFIIAVLLFNRRILTFKNRQRQLEINNLQVSHNLLRAQMNPHFLFNALNSIQSFITGNNPQQAEKFLIKFSRLIRSVLDFTSKSKIYINEEITALTDYIELEQLRLNDKFLFNIVKSDDIPVLSYIPPMLIQPFVENAIIHGLRSKEGQGLLSIKFTSIDNLLQCEIVDDGVGRKKSAEINSLKNVHHSSKGMEITTQRFMQLKSLNIRAGARIEDLSGPLGEAIGTKVILFIPYTNF